MFKLKKSLLIVLASLATLGASAEKYILHDVVMNPTGKTKSFAVKNNITEINYKKIFNSTEELEKYLDDIHQELENTRILTDITHSYVVQGKNDDGVNLVIAQYTFDESHSMIVFPKPTFDTNDGIEVKFKLKDANFLGLMNTMNIDINTQFGDEDHPDNYSRVTFGFNFDYDYPFNKGITKNTWSNALEFNWAMADSSAEFNYLTGITIGVPFGEGHQANFTVSQGISRNLDYEIFGDELYFTESCGIAVPFIIGYLDNTTAVVYTPNIGFNYYWDVDGIHKDNKYLNQNPILTFGHNIAINHVNWIKGNNFRNGYKFSAEQGIGWNFGADELNKSIVPTASGNVQFFKAFKYAGIAINIDAFAGYNSTKNMGKFIRGAADRQTYDDQYNIDIDNYALESPCAIVFNFDLPIHVVTTHWLDWFNSIFGDYETKPKAIKAIALVPRKLFRYLDFEMQINPFVDVGLFKNRATGHNFDIYEGIYTGGLEVLIYPERWRSFVVRASLGYDVGAKILDGHLGFDSSWRDPSKLWEAYFGLGLHF